MNVKIPKNNYIREFDQIVWGTVTNIITKSKNTKHFYISHFNSNDKEHLYFLYACFFLKGLYDSSQDKEVKKVYIDTSIWNIIKINRILGRKSHKVHKLKKALRTEAMNTVEILDYQREKAVKMTYPEFTYADIFDEFYNRKGI